MLTAAAISGLVKTVLSAKFDQAVETPPFHQEMWELFCSKHKQVAVAAPRG